MEEIRAGGHYIQSNNVQYNRHSGMVAVEGGACGSMRVEQGNAKDIVMHT